MYNRYIPQPDGSYRRNRMPDQGRPQPPQKPQPPKDPCPPMPKEIPAPPPKPTVIKADPKCQRQECRTPAGGINGFLRQLFPKDFDTSDLIVVLLLILMAGDCPEDQNTALLTLAIYLFL